LGVRSDFLTAGTRSRNLSVTASQFRNGAFRVSNERSIAEVSAVKGDRIEIVVDVGEGTRSYEVTATRAGRRVEVANRRGLVEVSEVTRTGTPVRTARFMASRIVSLVEYPANDRPAGP
jgi:hypothetical protein